MRASYIKDNVAALALLGADVEARVRAKLLPGLLDRIAQAARVEWLPLDVDVALTAAIHEEVGDAGVRRWGKTALMTSLQGPLLRPILDGAVRLLGLTPSSLLTRAPLVWRQVYKDCGEPRVHADDNKSMRVVVAGAPALLVDNRGYLEGTAGAFEAILEITKVRGTVDVGLDAGGAVAFVVRWGT